MSVHRGPEAIEELSRQAARSLRRADADIQSIVLFGSGVYAPDRARDLDLLVITSKKKDLDVYWDAVEDMPLGVDVVVKEVGEQLGEGLKLGVKVFGQLVWGESQYVKEVIGEMPVPTYEDARVRVGNAEEYMQLARAATDERRQQGNYRDAFNCLFDAGRLAAMTFLQTEETRWGQLRRQLPAPFDERFRRIVNELHVRYFYEFGYPAEGVEEAYQRWRAEVGQFIDDLERVSEGPEPSRE